MGAADVEDVKKGRQDERRDLRAKMEATWSNEVMGGGGGGISHLSRSLDNRERGRRPARRSPQTSRLPCGSA